MSGAEVRMPENPRGLRDLVFRVPETTAWERRRSRAIVSALGERYPEARCELEYRNPFELLMATVLSAQATDVGVNKATPGLFAAYPDAASMAVAEAEDLHEHIRTIGLYRNKAKALVSASRTLVERFGGEVPQTMEELLELRGVARKTANVVLGNAFGINVGFVVDTHIERLAKRFGLAPEDATTAMVERHLCARIPRAMWCDASHLLIFHGRRVCKARGGGCADDSICRRYCSNARA